MESLPHVSVVIPCFNQAKYLPDAIRSALCQTYTNLSVVVVNDGSSDDTTAVAREFGDRVSLVEQPNSGVNAARNVGMFQTDSEIIAFLDADDAMHPHCIETRIKPLLEDSSVGMVAGWYRLVDAELRPLPDALQSRAMPDLSKRDLYIKEMWSPTCGLLIRRRAIELCGPFDPLIQIAEDWDLQMRICRKFKHVYLADAQADYREVPGSASRNWIRMVDCIRQVLTKNRAYAPSAIRYSLTSFIALQTHYSGSIFGRILFNSDKAVRWRTLRSVLLSRPITIPLFILWVVRGAINRTLKLLRLKPKAPSSGDSPQERRQAE